MKRTVVLILFVLMVFSPMLQAKESEKSELKAFWNKCFADELREKKVLEFKNLKLKMDSADISLEKGTLFFTDKIGDNYYGVVFIGKGGSVDIDVPSTWHHELRETLKKENKKAASNLLRDCQFEEAFFFVPEDFLKQLGMISEKSESPLNYKADETVIVNEESEKYPNEKKFNRAEKILKKRIGSKDSRRIPVITLLKNHFNKNWNLRPLMADFNSEEYGWFSYSYNPEQEEEIQVGKIRQRAIKSGSNNWKGKGWARFQSEKDRKKPRKKQLLEDKSEVNVTHLNMDLKIKKGNLLCLSKSETTFKSKKEGMRILQMFLNKTNRFDKQIISVKRVENGKGEQLSYLHSDSKYSLIVDLGKTLKKDDKYTLFCSTEADIVQSMDWLNIEINGKQIPANEIRGLHFMPTSPKTYDFKGMFIPYIDIMGDHFTFDSTVKVPAEFTSMVSGKTTKRWKEEGYTCTKTEENNPMNFPFVIFGDYERLTDKSVDKDTTINIHSLHKQSKALENVMTDAKNVLQWYESSDVLGTQYPFEELDIAQMTFFLGFGQAPSGIVRLTGEYFLQPSQIAEYQNILQGGFGMNPGKLRDFYLPHEIAHEWWGHTVNAETTHDYWFVETLAEYSAAMCQQWYDKPERINEKINRWRRVYYGLDEKDDEPMFLANSVGGGTVRYSTRYALIYNKGPLMMHMMRMTLGSDLFLRSLRSVLQEYRYENIITPWLFDAFREEGKEYIREQKKKLLKEYKSPGKIPAEEKLRLNRILKFLKNLDTFVEDWYMGRGYAHVEFSSDVKKRGDKYVAKVTIKQDPSKFKHFYAPVYFYKDKDTDSLIKRWKWIDKPNFTFKLKLPWKPEDIRFDENRSTLSEVNYAK